MENFTGFWWIASRERRVAGEWILENDFEPEHWRIAFFPDGRYGELFEVPGMRCENLAGTWTLDEALGIISIHEDWHSEFARKCVFDGEWLYIYEDSVHIRTCRDAIIKHHAYERWRLVKIVL